MKHFLDDTDRMNDLNELLEHHRQFVLANMEVIDSEVENQKTRFYKFGCWLKYGHLEGSDGFCKRCKKRIIKAENRSLNGHFIAGDNQITASESTVNTTNK
jgi:hypothetical protein